MYLCTKCARNVLIFGRDNSANETAKYAIMYRNVQSQSIFRNFSRSIYHIGGQQNCRSVSLGREAQQKDSRTVHLEVVR